MNKDYDGPFLEQLRLVLQRSQLPVALLGAGFQVLWASDSILELLPGLRLPNGALDLLEGFSPDHVRQEIQSQGHFATYLPSMLFTGNGITICAAGQGEDGPVYLLQPAGDLESSSPQQVRQPAGLERMTGAFNTQFRLPLSQIFLELDALRDAIPEDEAHRAALDSLSQINRQSYRLLRCVRLITTFAESCYARPALPAQPGKAVDLYGTLRQLCVSCAELLDSRGIPLGWEIPEGRFPALCRRDELEVIFLSLISNSSRYTRPGNAIHVRVCPQPGGGMVTVSDRGRGIPSQMQPLVFQPYFSYEPGHGPFGGLGLGLSCAKGLVAALGGTIALTSQEGEGTSVTFMLPTAAVPLPLALEATCQDYLMDRFSPVHLLLSDSIPPALRGGNSQDL